MTGIRGNAHALLRRNVEASLRECISGSKGPSLAGPGEFWRETWADRWAGPFLGGRGGCGWHALGSRSVESLLECAVSLADWMKVRLK